MTVQGGVSQAHFGIAAMRLAQRKGHAKKESDFVEKIVFARRRFGAGYRQAAFPASGIARKVIVSGWNVTRSAAAGTPARSGSSSPAPSASVRPFSLTSASSRYTLDAASLLDADVRLNGRTLALGAGDELPDLAGVPTAADRVTFQPLTITFLAIPDAANTACR